MQSALCISSVERQIGHAWPICRIAQATTTAQHGEETIIIITQHRERHYHVYATSDDGTREEIVEAAYLLALATARRLVHEAQLPAGSVAFDALARRWLVTDAQGTPSASITLSGPCTGQHAAQEVPARVAA